MLEIQNSNDTSKFIILGIGGAGIRIINEMTDMQGEHVEFIGMDTDTHSLRLCKASKLLHISTELTEDSGTHADPAAGEHAAVESTEKISAVLTGADMVFLLCGMGGGTGTGAACAVADITKEMGIFTAAVVTSPFHFEEKARIVNAMNGIERLKTCADSITIVPNDEALANVDWDAAIRDTAGKTDDIIQQMIRSIVNLVNIPAVINLDIEDVQSTMKGTGITYIGIGESKGENAAAEAALMAVKSSWQDSRLYGADQVLLYITGTIDLADACTATRYVEAHTGRDTRIILGAHYADSECCTVSVIATCSEDPLNILLRRRQGECMRCWFTDKVYTGWRRGFFTAFCESFCLDKEYFTQSSSDLSPA